MADTPPRMEAEMLCSHPPSPEEVRYQDQYQGGNEPDGQAPASPAMPANTHVVEHEAATRTPAQRWELGEAQRTQMADMKSELTTRINEIKENNDLKINKCINQIDKINKVINQEISYTSTRSTGIQKVSDNLAKKVKNVEEYIADKFHEAISVAVQNKIENADLEFIEDMIKKHIDSKIEDKVNDNITKMIED